MVATIPGMSSWRSSAFALLLLGLACEKHPPAAEPGPPSPATKRAPVCVDHDLNTPDPRYVASKVTGVDIDGTPFELPDTCEGEHYVREGRCPPEPTHRD